MRFDIRYRTRFAYQPDVTESHNELRACPLTDGYQRLVAYRIGTLPHSRPLSFTDYWGTRVDAFGIRLPHRHLEVIAEATVDTTPRPLVHVDASLDELHSPEFQALHHEFLQPTGHTAWDDRLASLANERVAAEGPDVLLAAYAIHDLVRSSLRYEKGVTEIGAPVTEVFAGGAGVCQDFAHLAVAMSRAVGIPARYVSGYLFSSSDATVTDPQQPVVQVQTHAWIEVAVPRAGWWPLDPTNGRAVGELHVKVGHGRDYDDVSPLRGVHKGKSVVALEAGVEIRKGDPITPGSPVAMIDAWSPAESPMRAHLGARAVTAMPELDLDQQQQQQQ